MFSCGEYGGRGLGVVVNLNCNGGAGTIVRGARSLWKRRAQDANQAHYTPEAHPGPKPPLTSPGFASRRMLQSDPGFHAVLKRGLRGKGDVGHQLQLPQCMEDSIKLGGLFKETYCLIPCNQGG